MTYIDPEGKVALAAGYVLWGGAAITATACYAIQPCRDHYGAQLQGIADGIGQGIQWCIDQILPNTADQGNQSQNAEEQKKNERARYHQICDTPPHKQEEKDDESRCINATNEIIWHRQCLDARTNFANKWHNGTFEDHETVMYERRQALNKAISKAEYYCTD
jgi:hypothetical protein